MTPLDLARLSERHVVFACSCGGRRWVNDENWQPDPRDRDIGPSRADGLIPCGSCNFAGWDTPENEPAKPTCREDDQDWPCDAAALLSEIVALRKVRDAAAHLRRLQGGEHTIEVSHAAYEALDAALAATEPAEREAAR